MLTTLIHHVKSGRTHCVITFTILSIAVPAEENRLKSFQFFATVNTLRCYMENIALFSPLIFPHKILYIYTYIYICSAQLGNLAGCVTGFQLHNRITGYTTGHPDRILESLPVRLLNQLTILIATQLCNWVGVAIPRLSNHIASYKMLLISSCSATAYGLAN